MGAEGRRHSGDAESESEDEASVRIEAVEGDMFGISVVEQIVGRSGSSRAWSCERLDYTDLYFNITYRLHIL